MEKTMVIWRKLGREHDERGYFRTNRPDVVSAYLQDQVDRFRRLPEEDWRWWQPNEDVILEKPITDADWRPARAIYHLPRRKWVVVEDAQIRAPGFDESWTWYVHIGDIVYDPSYSSWVFTDHFCDVVVREDLRTYAVLDLHELGAAIAMKLIKPALVAGILADTQKLLDLVRLGDFPPREIRECRDLVDGLGWDRQPE